MIWNLLLPTPNVVSDIQNPTWYVLRYERAEHSLLQVCDAKCGRFSLGSTMRRAHMALSLCGALISDFGSSFEGLLDFFDLSKYMISSRELTTSQTDLIRTAVPAAMNATSKLALVSDILFNRSHFSS